ncbi:MAG: OmpA family protein [Proteobacteria bacterium]|nr:OmpA family protein [Pseudomonadota bacterium]
MKIRNLAIILSAAGALAACSRGTTTTVSEPSDLNYQRVFFAFDSSAITDNASANLAGQALYLKSHPDTKILVAGNCDERGTIEYNLALGARRASAAKKVIVANGVSASRIDTISFGKERPWKLGTGEDVWQWNRNATTTVQ